MILKKSDRILMVDDNTAIHEDFRKILEANPSRAKLDAGEAAIFGVPSKTSPGSVFQLSIASRGQEALSLTQRACPAGSGAETGMS